MEEKQVKVVVGWINRDPLLSSYKSEVRSEFTNKILYLRNDSTLQVFFGEDVG